MKKQTLVDRIESYFKKHPDEWICGGFIQQKAAECNFEPQNAGRRLRELAAEGFLEVSYIKGKNKVAVAWYKYLPQQHEITKITVIGDRAVVTKQQVLC